MAEEFDSIVRKPLLEYVPGWIKPNHLTALRAILLGPLIVFRGQSAVAVSIVLLSSLCDLFDGPLARIRKQATQTGAVFDATMDKIFILGAFCFACSQVSTEIIVIIFILDALLTFIRPIKRLLKVKADANPWGAAKVWTQTTAICLDLLHDEWSVGFLSMALYIAIFFAFCSLYMHLEEIVTHKKSN
ncbi:MAG: CDP-alcohol phosphatidyltransferase family protein [Patescibacteria group bacterium]